ncbi:DUF6702 family protein [Pseudocolwellia agarivorans]|mgnify:FL=1|uniref:DUF6702 family protein n=1 Tax=Pseudocolwellia agarivorans TaxID=1911682 RepID=UPI000987C613|nr:DUF6702 family protein [Pseudocolwellia agarivorans]
MINRLLKSITILLFWAVAANAAAHSYFFGITDLTLNESSKKIEIIHQFTAHDLENAIAEIKQIHFSPEHKQYELYLKEYIDEHFTLNYSNQDLKLNWVGLEVKRGNIFIYQEVPFENFLVGLLVKNDLLVNTYPKQINTLNFQDSTIKGSLTFSASQKIAKIDGIK